MFDTNTESTGCSYIGEVGAVSSHTARRLACDAGITPLIYRIDGRVEAEGKTRSIPRQMRRAVLARDGGAGGLAVPAVISSTSTTSSSGRMVAGRSRAILSRSAAFTIASYTKAGTASRASLRAGSASGSPTGPRCRSYHLASEQVAPVWRSSIVRRVALSGPRFWPLATPSLSTWIPPL